MYRSDCQHIESQHAGEVCVHLFDGKAEEFYRCFTGENKQYNLICPKCKTYLEKFQLSMKKVCLDCFDKIDSNGDFFNFIGEPSYDYSPDLYHFNYQEITVPALQHQYIMAMQPLLYTSGSQWIIFDGLGNLQLLDLSCNTIVLINQVSNDLIDKAGDIHIIVSNESDYVAIISRSRLMKDTKDWNKGVVLDLISGEITMLLSRGDYHTAVSEFPIAFFRDEERTLIIHATNWNRLDISDPATGIVISEREFNTRPTEAWRFNQNTMTEFSGRLSVSPNQQWLIDDGWQWGPVGCLSLFSISRWLNDNVWEADNGPSKSKLVMKNYFWGAPSCCLDGDTLCVWGQGTDEKNIIPAAVLFDINTREQIDWFPGPSRGLFVYDQLLYTTDENDNLSAWDLSNGNRVVLEKGFSPQLYHATSRQFLSYQGKGVFTLGQIEF